jgi:probable HAF family extracellular repeat protein
MDQVFSRMVRLGVVVGVAFTLTALVLTRPLLLPGSVPGAAAASTTYNITTLGTQAFGINDNGQATGWSTDAFLFTPSVRNGASGTFTDLGTLGGNFSSGRGINASGQVAGFSTNARGTYRAFLYTGGTLRDIGSLRGGTADAYGINVSGQVVGYSTTGQVNSYNEPLYHAFLWTPSKPNGKTGKMTDLGTLGGDLSIAYGVNRSGEVVGYAYNATGSFLAFLYNQGQMSSLGTLGGDWSIAYAVNDAGQIVGQAYTSNNVGAHAFLWQNGTMIDLGTLTGGNYASALAINSTGQEVVGTSTVPSNSGYLIYHAFVYEPGSMTDLNNLIPAGSGWLLQSATGVNDAGEIVGYGTYQGQQSGFLLTPP